MTPALAPAFDGHQGTVLEASRQACLASLAAAIIGEPMQGSWRTHAYGRAIFAPARAARDGPDVPARRPVEGSLRFVRARLWPAPVRLRNRFAPSRLACRHEVHALDGRHRIEAMRCPGRVRPAIATAAHALDDKPALDALAMFSPELGAP